MKIAENTLSKNLANIFGHKFNDSFKKEADQVIEKIKKKYSSDEDSYKLSPETIKFWITADPQKNEVPFRYPTLAHLVKIADVLEIDLGDLFIDKDKYLKISNLSLQKKRIIEKLLELQDEDLVSNAESHMIFQGELQKYRDQQKKQSLEQKETPPVRKSPSGKKATSDDFNSSDNRDLVSKNHSDTDEN